MKFIFNDKWLSLFFGGVVFAFFAFLYPYHLNYQEQFQMFLFTGDYFAPFFAKPGGFSDYLGNFFTQFNFYSWLGAIIIAVLLVLMQRLVWLISKRFGANSLSVPLSFLPSMLSWVLLCDENFLLGGVVAMLLVTGFIGLYLSIKSVKARMVYWMLSIPLVYWLCGGVFMVMPLLALAWELIKVEMPKSRLALIAAGCLLLSVVVPLIARNYFLQFPLVRVWLGVNYYRFPAQLPIAVLLIWGLMAVMPVGLRYLNRLSVNHKVVFFASLFVIVAGGAYLIRNSMDLAKEEVMGYDFNVRMRRWDRVVAMADKKTPMSPMSVTCLNLALAKQELLGERMFHYFQNGVTGLMPDFTRDYTIPMITGEVYYHLGMINTAQRYTFEAMEALPDYQKSSRAMMRLAETNLINGHYDVARRYLHLLQHTFYYSKWADRALATIEDEQRIADHPEWGLLRQMRTKEDFFFSEGEKNMMLGIMFQQNPQNRMAYEYLMAYCLLTKDLQHFWQYFPLGKELMSKHIPKSFQEALVYIWATQNNDPSKPIPYPVSKSVVQRIQSFGQMAQSQMNSEASLRENFGDTYWYYLQFRK